MSRPVVGIIGNAHFVENRFNLQAVGVRNLKAVAEVAGALPLMFATEPGVTDIATLLEVVDGVVLTGARANVHPTRFRTEPNPRHEPQIGRLVGRLDYPADEECGRHHCQVSMHH